MSKIFSFFSPSPPRPAAPPPVATPTATKQPSTKKASRRSQLIALRATGAAGLTDQANIGRRKILV